MAKFISTKTFIGFPCTHRQFNASSHCRFVHGYSRSFYFEFACDQMSKEGWVLDFGGLKKVKDWLNYFFDHTFLASEADPFLQLFKDLDKKGIIQLRVMPNVSMEGSAEFVYKNVNKIIDEITNSRVWVTKVEVRENQKNSAIYIP